MNHNEKDRIAAAINNLRPDWPAKSIRTVLDDPRLSSRPRRDVAVALTWIACDSLSKTPARVHESGPWWGATNEGDRANRPPKRDEACGTCGKRPEQHRPEIDEHEFITVELTKRDRSQPPTDLRTQLQPTVTFGGKA